jgi:hypothetical protein
VTVMISAGATESVVLSHAGITKATAESSYIRSAPLYYFVDVPPVEPVTSHPVVFLRRSWYYLAAGGLESGLVETGTLS